MTLQQTIEALVFASPKPLLAKEIVAAFRAAAEDSEDAEVRDFAALDEAAITVALTDLQADLREQGRAFHLVEQVNGWTLVTDPAAARWVRQLYPEAKPTRLSGPALETLAIIAYRQPVTRADVEAVRGVAVDGVMQVLLERGLVKIAGRSEMPGRPLLYSTTEYFLQHFGLKTVEELPNADELRRVPLPTPASIAAAEKPATLEASEPPVQEDAAPGVENPAAPADSSAAPEPASSEAPLPAVADATFSESGASEPTAAETSPSGTASEEPAS